MQKVQFRERNLSRQRDGRRYWPEGKRLQNLFGLLSFKNSTIAILWYVRVCVLHLNNQYQNAFHKCHEHNKHFPDFTLSVNLKFKLIAETYFPQRQQQQQQRYSATVD